MPDSVRFKDCDLLTFRCRKCSGEMPFMHISQREVRKLIRVLVLEHLMSDQIPQTSILKSEGPQCAGCQAPLTEASMLVQLENQIRGHINRYYEGWTICDDATCRNRTRMMSVYGRRCLKRDCRGAVSFEVNSSHGSE